MYDRCLEQADAAREQDRSLPKRDFTAYERLYAKPFAPFPKTLPELLEQGLVYGCYAVTPKGAAARGTINTTNIHDLVRQGFVHVEGIRYEDFLPVSAAGIFASNLNQYGTQSTAALKPVYTRATLEEILGKPIVDANVMYSGMQAASLLETFTQLGVLNDLPAARRGELASAVAACPPDALPESKSAPVPAKTFRTPS